MGIQIAPRMGIQIMKVYNTNGNKNVNKVMKVYNKNVNNINGSRIMI